MRQPMGRRRFLHLSTGTLIGAAGLVAAPRLFGSGAAVHAHANCDQPCQELPITDLEIDCRNAVYIGEGVGRGSIYAHSHYYCVDAGPPPGVLDCGIHRKTYVGPAICVNTNEPDPGPGLPSSAFPRPTYGTVSASFEVYPNDSTPPVLDLQSDQPADRSVSLRVFREQFAAAGEMVGPDGARVSIPFARWLQLDGDAHRVIAAFTYQARNTMPPPRLGDAEMRRIRAFQASARPKHGH